MAGSSKREQVASDEAQRDSIRWHEISSKCCMGNPALDQLIHSLFAMVVPILIGCAIVGSVLGAAVKWLERRAVRLGKSIGKTRALRQMQTDAANAPHCSSCNSLMVRRKAKRGVNAGSEFWGCSTYPTCRGTRAI